MAEYAAFDAALWIGTQQEESTPIVGAITGAGAGNATVTIIAAGMGGGGNVAVVVALANNDIPTTSARKMAAALNLDADVGAWMVAYTRGAELWVRLIEPADNDATLNIAYTNTTCAGLTPDPNSDVEVGGVAELEVAQVTNISGPGLGLDTEDVTTHDQATAWEENVATIIRSGEVTLDIVYDPVDGTHDAGTGLIFRLETKLYSFFKLIFPDAGDTEWEFSGYVTSFEPGSPVGGALTATVKAKIATEPLLA